MKFIPWEEQNSFGEILWQSQLESEPCETGVIDFGQFRLRPACFFEFGQFDFGQFRLRPISTSANFDFGQSLDVEFLDHKGGAPEGWRPRKGGGPERVEAQT